MNMFQYLAFAARGTGKDREFAKSVPVFPCRPLAGQRYGAAPSAGRCPPAPARRGRGGVMRSARLSTRARRAAMPQAGAPKQGIAPHRRSLWRWPGENPSAIVGSLADNSSLSARATAVAPRHAGDDLIHLTLHQPRQRGTFTLLLKRDAGMLLLAAAADAKMRAARRLALRAVG